MSRWCLRSRPSAKSAAPGKRTAEVHADEGDNASDLCHALCPRRITPRFAERIARDQLFVGPLRTRSPWAGPWSKTFIVLVKA